MIRGNVMIAAAAFIFASEGNIDFWLLTALLVGTSLVIASSCVFNNYIDAGIDATMTRTKKRALVTGRIPAMHAVLYASFLGVIGLLILGLYTNLITLFIGVLGMVFYVVIYGLFKRNSVHGTVIGSISGALPPVAGYAAVTNELDLAALLLFLCLVFWQMPHFYAIAVYSIKDYKSANLPVLPIINGASSTKKQILIYILGFIICCLTLTALGYTEPAFGIVMLSISIFWLLLGAKGLMSDNSESWARQMFKFSLVVLLTFAVMLALNSWIS